MKNLKRYEPSEKMWQAFYLKFNDDILGKNDPIFRKYLETLQLSDDNVCSVLRTLLTIEDISAMERYSQLTQYNVQIDTTNQGKLCIPLPQTNINYRILVPHIDDVLFEATLPRPSKAEHQLMRLPYGSLFAGITKLAISKLFFESKNEDFVLFKFNPKISSKKWLNKKFDVMFRTPRIPCRLMYRALNVLMLGTSSHARRYLFPTDQKVFVESHREQATFPLFNESIATNPEQLQAVQQIVAGPNPKAPHIIFGPPGCGKTTTIVEAILQLYIQKSCRILVTAASNSACDTIALKIIECLEKDKRFLELPNVLIRLVSKTRLMRGAKLMHPSVLKFSNYVSRGGKKDQVVISDYGIIVATLCTAGMRARAVNFSYIFIDEASSCSEPEAILAIAGIKDKDCHVILSGDHKQLGPVVMSKRAVKLGLGQSLMERLMLHKWFEVDTSSGNYDRTLQSRLVRSYRAHPEILGLFNKLYYNNEIIPLAPMAQVNQAEKWSIIPNGLFPILFQAVHGHLKSESKSTSSYNIREAQVLCWYVRTLLEGGLGDMRVEQKDIGVITPYLGQCRLLTYMLRKRKLINVHVGTVESFQGREMPIIIASLVSSYTNNRFLSSPRRLNVMISRARSLLILIGNPTAVSTNGDLDFIVQQCKLNRNLLDNEPNLMEDIIDDLEGLNLSNVDDEDDDSSSCSSSISFIGCLEK